MAMVIATLAADIASGVGAPGVTPEITAWATGIIQEITTNASVANAPGTVNGVAPTSGGPLIAGLATGGVISGMTGSSMADFVVAASGGLYPFASPEMICFCNGIVLHIQSSGLVGFAAGTIVGACSNTLVSPGALVGSGVGGTVSGIDGSAMASIIVGNCAAFFPSTTPQLIGKCSAICNHIKDNAVASYLAGTVVATCSAGGGPIIAGAGTGGKIA